MKKFIQFILLVCCCIVFTGCGGNSNSYDGAYRITISKKYLDAEPASSSRAATSGAKDIKLFLNGVEFPGHSFDSDGNYIFTKVMFEQEANQVISHEPSIIELFEGSKEEDALAVFEVERVAPLPQSIIITWIDATHFRIDGSNGSIGAYYYTNASGIKYPQEGLKKVKRVEIKKIDSLKARVTFYNVDNIGVEIDYDSWTISGTDKGNNKSASYTYSENEANRYFLVTPSIDGDSENGYSISYIISLTDNGETKANVGNHTLDNTIVKIDNIIKDGHNVVDTGILEQATWYPNK